MPIEECKRLREEGYKSINIKMLGDPNYKIYEIPSVKKRLFLDSDYTILMNIAADNCILNQGS